MYSKTAPAEHTALPPKTWSQKLRRGVSQLLLHANTLALRPASLSAKRQYLFVLSHMRSGSTLLCHVLCTSNEIIGFGEAHIQYQCRSDLAKLLVSVRIHTGKNPLQYRYVMDKLVGAHDVLSTSILADSRTRYLFLVREPMASIGSIVAMRRGYFNETLDQAVEFATNYYAERLPQFVALAAKINDPHRCFLVTHSQLLAETTATYRALQGFLGLEAPLREEYEITPTSGKLGIGDPSSNIRLGKIDRSLPRKETALPTELLNQMQNCYKHCVDELGKIIPTIGTEL
jgi:hypothetical protein